MFPSFPTQSVLHNQFDYTDIILTVYYHVSQIQCRIPRMPNAAVTNKRGFLRVDEQIKSLHRRNAEGRNC